MAFLKRLLPLLLIAAFPAFGEVPDIHVLAYHDIRDDVAEDFDPDQFAVSTAKLIDQFTWLRENGYQPVSVDHLIAAQSGEIQLPDKAVLLTFDDGLVSFYTHLFPLLKLFDYPAVVSVVTNWIENDVEVVVLELLLRAGDLVLDVVEVVGVIEVVLDGLRADHRLRDLHVIRAGLLHHADEVVGGLGVHLRDDEVDPELAVGVLQPGEAPEVLDDRGRGDPFRHNRRSVGEFYPTREIRRR